MSIWRSVEDFEREWESRLAAAKRAEEKRADDAGFVARLAQRLASQDASATQVGLRARDVTAPPR